MFIHMTIVRMDAGHLNKVVEVWAAKHEAEQLPAGLVQSFVLESMDEPGQVIWLSFWDSAREAKVFIASPRYAELLGELQPYLEFGPEWRSYRLFEQMDCVQSRMLKTKFED